MVALIHAGWTLACDFCDNKQDVPLKDIKTFSQIQCY